MKITVILCSYNRCQRLAKALESLAVSSLPDSDEWEVLIVDNNSTDQTREVADDFCERYPGRFRYLFESEQGKSYALNSGIKESHSDVLVFADDDAVVDSAWLRNLTGVLRSREWAGAGGRIILQWPDSLPPWLSIDGPESRHCFPALDQGSEAKELVGPPFGANMAFRREIFEKYGGFRVDLGPNPDNQIRSEDTEFGRRVIAAGERLCYVPSAVVRHPVEADLINKRHFLKWWYDNGRANAREFQTNPVQEFCRIAAWTLRWTTTFQPGKRFYRKLVVWEKVGRLIECFRVPSDVVRKSRQYEPVQKTTADSSPLS